MPKVPKSIIPTITTDDRMRICHQYMPTMAGCTIIPTEMKKTAPKRSLTGVTTVSMRSAKLVPASIEPITKAPRASEKPQ